ncbi:MAG: hypothetical protein GX028_09290 [Clostridiaceae bacterium]|nr:hypothetical protein [Clostridiaceae bacterium]
MKKLLLTITAIMLTFALALSAAGCAGKDDDKKSGKLEGSLEDILKQIYEKAELSDDFRQWTEEGLLTNEINDENEEYHLGKKGIVFKEAIISEPMMMPSAYALCLIRANEDQDIEALKTEMKDSANPNKWICVGVDEKNVLVDNVGDVVMLVMSDDNAQAIMDAFKAFAS